MRWRLVDTRRFDVLERGYNSPVPDPAELPPRRERFALDLDAQRPLLQRVLDASRDFTWERNAMYGPTDSRVLAGMLRVVRPQRIVELGSGSTTRLIERELGRRHEVFDPAATGVKAQDVPLDVFTSLRSGDVLFVDTTHIVRTGGDVVRIVLDVLPRLAPGVYVHFHDVLLPDEVDRRWLDNGWYWTEQYLLQAFLEGNDAWRVELAVHALGLGDPETELASAFWIRRV
jgi:hypothetical protein